MGANGCNFVFIKIVQKTCIIYICIGQEKQGYKQGVDKVL